MLSMAWRKFLTSHDYVGYRQVLYDVLQLLLCCLLPLQHMRLL